MIMKELAGIFVSLAIYLLLVVQIGIWYGDKHLSDLQRGTLKMLLFIAFWFATMSYLMPLVIRLGGAR